MQVRRVVTGHTVEGRSIVASDESITTMPVGSRGTGVALLWGRDDPGDFPDDGSPQPMEAGFPALGGCACAIWELAPEDDEFDDFVARALAPWADAGEPGMHRTATLDYDIVLEGVIGLQLDDGVEVTLGPGDVVVQNGTRHRWRNRGDTIARMVAVTVGARHRVAGGKPA
jgi:mannose-6-phosphate isomerase-like protein (cupin superfamily)